MEPRSCCLSRHVKSEIYHNILHRSASGYAPLIFPCSMDGFPLTIVP